MASENRKKPKSKIEEARQDLRSWAGSIIKAVGIASPPVPIRPLIEFCMAEVEFKPLLVAGATGGKEYGFRIYCDCERDDVAIWNEILEDPNDQGRTLPNHARFTIAHELAHTFFFEIGDNGEPKANKKHLGVTKEIDSLEEICNDGASYLLMPSKFMDFRRQELNLLDPECLWFLCEKFRVSPESLIIRIERDRLWRPNIGVAALVIRNAGSAPVVNLIAKDKRARPFLEEIKNGMLLGTIPIIAPALKIFGGKELRTQGIIELGTDLLKCTIREYDPNFHLSLVTVELHL